MGRGEHRSGLCPDEKSSDREDARRAAAAIDRRLDEVLGESSFVRSALACAAF